jgi:hypothetical protein
MRRLFTVATLAVLLTAGAAFAARAATPDPTAYVDRGVQQVRSGAAALCRTPLRSATDPSAPEACTPVDGRTISEAQVQNYESGWVHRALSLQRGLDAAAPLAEEQLPHTHNSFNSSSYTLGSTSYYPTLTNQDPNQVYSLTDQLRMDVRAIEIDVHWWPSPYGNARTGGKWVTMCHGDSSQVQGVHVGCTWDRPFQDGLAELKAWLVAHPDQFILLYLENQLDDRNGPNPQAHAIAAQLIAEGLGSLVYQPPAGQPCASMPTNESRTEMANADGGHHQVLIVGNCGPGAWGSWVHEREPHWDEHGDPSTYNDAACTADKKERAADPALFRREFEDSTWLTATLGDGSNHLSTPATVAEMVRCGVNIMGLDQLTPQDPRLAALVWSWAENEPAAGAGTCADQGSDGRFHAGDCSDSHRFACVDGAGAWHVTAATGRWNMGNTLCGAQFRGSHFGVPPNGLRNQQIVDAKGSSSTPVWLNYASINGTWTPSL